MKKMGERKGTQVQREKMATNKYLSIITLNLNGFNAPIKRHNVAEWIRKHDLHICCLQETYLRTKDLHRMKVKGWKMFSKQMDMKKSWGSNTCIKQNRFQNKGHNKRQSHYTILKGVVQQEDITLVNIYAPNIEYLNT